MNGLLATPRGARRLVDLLAVLALCASLVGCGKKKIAEVRVADDSTAEVTPLEPDTLHQQIQVTAAKTGQSAKEILEATAKSQVLLDYSAIVVGDGSGPAYVDPKTHKLCWAAFTCKNKNCPGKGKNGKPFLFAYRYPGVVVGADGKPDWSQSANAPPMTMLDVCPACLKAHTVVPYHEPGEVQRLNQINRQAARVAKQIQDILQQGGQPPQELMDQWHQSIGQRGKLPAYYLEE